MSRYVSSRENKKSDSPQTARLCIFYGQGATAVFGHDPTREKRIQKSLQAFLNPK